MRTVIEIDELHFAILIKSIGTKPKLDCPGDPPEWVCEGIWYDDVQITWKQTLTQEIQDKITSLVYDYVGSQS